MLNMNMEQNETELVMHLEGRLDSYSAPELEKEIKKLPDMVLELVLECKGLRYLSSAGLRIILSADKMMAAKGGRLVIRNVNSLVMEVFDMTGLVELLTIENGGEV